MTVIMLDCRDAFFAECARQNIGQIHSYPERVFGFQDVGFADDTNLIHVHLPSLRILVKCYLKEAAFYGFFANNAPQPDGKSFLLSFNPDMAIIRVKDLDGRDFPLVPEAKTLGIVYSLSNCGKCLPHAHFFYARLNEPVRICVEIQHNSEEKS